MNISVNKQKKIRRIRLFIKHELFLLEVQFLISKALEIKNSTSKTIFQKMLKHFLKDNVYVLKFT